MAEGESMETSHGTHSTNTTMGKYTSWPVGGDKVGTVIGIGEELEAVFNKIKNATPTGNHHCLVEVDTKFKEGFMYATLGIAGKGN